LVSLLWARLFFEHIEIRMPLVQPDTETAQRWLLLSRGDRIGDAAEIAEKDVRSEFERRLQMQKDLATEMSGQTADILRWLAQFGDSAIKKLPAIDEKFWDLVSAPRNLSLQFLNWE
jgi:hypothetical protein